MLRRLLAVSVLAFTCSSLRADEKGMTVQEFEASLHFQRGHVALPGGKAALDVPSNLRFLDASDTERVVQAWGNPPGTHALGMLVPAEVGPLSNDGWGVVITYSADGHVSDEEADSINYTELLGRMQEQAREGNEARKKQGYPTVELAGWAEPPHYDKSSHKLYWAKELAFGSEGVHTLNYAVRVLGREGVLELNAVAAMPQLPDIKRRMEEVIDAANFTDGNRYADFNSSTDKTAAYGIAALVGGAVAAKAGLFAKLLALLIAAKKLVIVAVLGVVAAIGKLFGRKKD